MQKPNKPNPFGKAARAVRSELGLSLRDMARSFNTSDSRLSQIELGIRPVSFDMCKRYINFFFKHGRDAADELWEARARSLMDKSYRIEDLDALSRAKIELVLFLGERINEITDKDATIVLQQLKERSRLHRKNSQQQQK